MIPEVSDFNLLPIVLSNLELYLNDFLLDFENTKRSLIFHLCLTCGICLKSLELLYLLIVIRFVA